MWKVKFLIQIENFNSKSAVSAIEDRRSDIINITGNTNKNKLVRYYLYFKQMRNLKDLHIFFGIICSKSNLGNK